MVEQLPPKTCEIERMITVRADIDKVLNGRKTATRRNGRYADVGEIMMLDGRRFEVSGVYRQSLGEITNDEAIREGFPDLESYKAYILSMHRGMQWSPQAKVWVHEFREVQ